MFKPKNIRGPFALKIDKYLDFAHKRGLIYKIDEFILRGFDTYCKVHSLNIINGEIISDFTTAASDRNLQQIKIYACLRRFYYYLASYDPSLPEIPKGKKPSRQRHQVYIFTDDDINIFIKSIPLVVPKIESYVLRGQCLFGLLACTGMRVSEALNLNLMDINYDNKVLKISKGKFGKSRLVPVHDSTIEAINRYRKVRLQCFDNAQPLFVNRFGQRMPYLSAFCTFNKILSLGVIEYKGFPRPTIHCLRHSFAVRTILNWYDQGLNCNDELIKLSTYLGHTKIHHTVYYLESAGLIISKAFKLFKPLENINEM